MLPAPRSPDGRTIREDHPIPAEPGIAASIMPVTKLYDRTSDAVSLDEVERVVF
jgi:hypothetical protein